MRAEVDMRGVGRVSQTPALAAEPTMAAELIMAAARKMATAQIMAAALRRRVVVDAGAGVRGLRAAGRPGRSHALLPVHQRVSAGPCAYAAAYACSNGYVSAMRVCSCRYERLSVQASADSRV